MQSEAKTLQKFDWFTIEDFPLMYQAAVVKSAQFFHIKQQCFIDILLITTMEHNLIVLYPQTKVTVIDRIPELL